MNLYNIQQNYLQLMEDIENEEGVLTPELEERLKISEENFKEKITQYCKIVRTVENDITFCSTEIERINKIIETKRNTVDRLEKIMLEAIKMFGDREQKEDKSGAKYYLYKYSTETFKLSSRRSKSVSIPDESIIDNKWKRVSISELSMEEATKIVDLLGKSVEEVKFRTDVLKTPIKKAIEDDGEIIEGASLVENYTLTLK